MEKLATVGQFIGSIILVLAVGIFMSSCETWFLCTIGLLNEDNYRIFVNVSFFINVLIFITYLKRNYQVEKNL